MVISEPEASIVRTIFDLYVNKLYGLQRICDYLDNYEVPKPTSRSGAWSIGTVRNILINEAYTGKWRYRKTKRVTKTRTQARPPEEWLETTIPAVVSEGLFAAVQLRREANKREQGRQRRRDYALAGMLTCAHCGKAVVGIARQERRFYVCGARRDSVKRYGFRCNSGWTPAQDLEAAVWGWIRSLLLEPEKLRQAIEDYQTQQHEQIQPLLAMLESNQMRLSELEKEKARLIGAYAKGVLSLDELAVQKTGLDKAIADLGKAIAMLRAEAEPNLPSPERIETIEAVAAELRDALHQADNDPKRQREIYQLLTVRVTVSHENGQCWATASCDLGNARLSLEYSTTGWYEWEAAPEVDAAGAPLAFIPGPPYAQKLAIWQRGIDRAAAQHPYMGLLVSRHAGLLYASDLQRLAGDERRATERFIAHQESWVNQVRHWLAGDAELRHAAAEPVLMAHTRLLQFGDSSSLQVAMPWSQERLFAHAPVDFVGTYTAITMRWEGQTISYDPWPFGVDHFTVNLHGRILDQSTFPDHDAYRRALAAAPLQTLEWHVVRA